MIETDNSTYEDSTEKLRRLWQESDLRKQEIIDHPLENIFAYLLMLLNGEISFNEDGKKLKKK